MDRKFLLVGVEFGFIYAKVLKKFNREIHSIVSTNSEICGKFLAELDYIPSQFPDYRAAFKAESFTDVIVATPPSVRSEIVIAAFEHGANVIVAKPFATSQIECYQILSAAKKHDKHIVCEYTCLENVLMVEALTALVPHAVAMTFGGPKTAKFPVVYDWLVHNLSLCVYCYGLPLSIRCEGNDQSVNSWLDYGYFKVSIRNATGWGNKVRNIFNNTFIDGKDCVLSYNEIDGVVPERLTKNGGAFPLSIFEELKNPIDKFFYAYLLTPSRFFSGEAKMISEITYLNELAAASLILNKRMEICSKDVLYVT